MELLKNLSKIYNYIFPVEDFLYLLQLEDYYSEIYFQRVWRFFFRRNIAKRGRLINSLRINLTRFFVYLIVLVDLLIFIRWADEYLAYSELQFSTFIITSLIVYSLLTPVIVGVVNVLLFPLITYFKNQIVEKGKILFQKSGLKSIGIVGSFGKTTVRNQLKDLMQYNYKVITPEGNINTAGGLAKWLQLNIKNRLDYVLFETDGYKLGEVREAAHIFRPEIVVVTNIGDQHLMRLGRRKILAYSLLEAVEEAKSDATVFMNASTYEEFMNLVGDSEFKKRLSERKLIIVESEDLKSLSINVAKLLKVDEIIINEFKNSHVYVDRRGDIKDFYGFEVLDYSYNISYQTAIYSIDAAVKYAQDNRKKLAVITAGIPELGEENSDGNVLLGKALDKSCDKVFLLNSVVAKEVEQGFDRSDKVVMVQDLDMAWKSIVTDLDPKEYVILFFPELDDLYY